MIDLNWTKPSSGLAFFFLIAYLCYVIVYYRKNVKYPQWQHNQINWGLFLFSLFLIIVVSDSWNSDWYSYQKLVWEYDFRVGAANYGEPIYSFIVRFVNRNYLLFRLFVWGGAFLLTRFSFRRFGLNVNIASFVLVSVFLLKFNYARATLGMSCYFFGLTFLLKPLKKGILDLIIISLSFIGAYAFHHSMLVLLAFTLLVYLPLDKPVVLLVLAMLLPAIGFVMSKNVNFVDAFDDEYLTNKVQGGLAHTAEPANLYGVISNIISYGAFVIPLLATLIIVFKNKKELDISIVRLFRLMVCVDLFALSFLFMGLPSYLLVYRHLYMTFIPLTILSVWFYEKRLMRRKWLSFIVLWGILSQSYSLFYQLYNTLR